MNESNNVKLLLHQEFVAKTVKGGVLLFPLLEIKTSLRDISGVFAKGSTMFW
jgi:hypothetical protein